MKLLRIFYLLFAVMLITTSCSRTNEQLLRAEQIVENAPDSAMSILNKFDYNKLSDKDKAFATENKQVRQLIDLALLANNMLKGEALANFVKRSVEMM